MTGPSFAGPPVQPQVVQPAPVPFTFQTGHAATSDGPRVVFKVHSLTGVGVYFCTPDEADGFAAGLVESARLARSGLIVPDFRGNGHPQPPEGTS